MKIQFKDTLRIGTRGSPLAMVQARTVQKAWHSCFPDAPPSQIVEIKTTGDVVLDRPLSEIGGKGLFTRELDSALIDGRIDIAVHSMKDVPTFLPEEVVIAAMLPRDDARDGWISASGKNLRDLPAGARVGSCSLRRRAQLARIRPDIVIVDLRGNIQTRLRKLDEGQFAATLLAMAGLNRMGLHPEGLTPLEVDEMVPAAGQAAVGIAAHRNSADLLSDLSAVNHRVTSLCVECERAMLAALDGSCRTPIGAYATSSGSTIRLKSLLASPDGTLVYERKDQGIIADREAIGQNAGIELKRAAGPNFLSHW